MVSRVLVIPGIVFFVEAKRDIEMLLLKHYALEFHIKKTNKLIYVRVSDD